MKLRKLFGCLVVIMAVSTVATATIVMTSDWSGSGDVWGYYASSEAEANAYGSQQTEYSTAYGWWQLLTTEAGEFDWWYYIEANAYAHIFYEDVDDAVGRGYSWAEADLSDFREEPPYYPDIDAAVEVEDEDCGDPPDFKYFTDYPTPMSESNTDSFDENDKIYCHHYVSAYALITEGSDSETKGWSDAGAAIDLSES